MLPSETTEPLRRIAVFVGVLVVAAQVLVGPLVDFTTALGWTVTPEVQGAFEGLLRAIVALLGILGVTQVGRGAVFSPATTQAIANASTYLPAGSVPDIGQPPEGIMADADATDAAAKSEPPEDN